MKVLMIMMLALVAQSAAADTTRLKVHPASGELTPFDRPPCPPATRALVWRIVGKSLYIEIAGEQMLVALGDRKRTADSTTTEQVIERMIGRESGSQRRLTFTIGIFDLPSEHATIDVEVSRDEFKRGARGVRIRATVNSCTVTWSGLAEVL